MRDGDNAFATQGWGWGHLELMACLVPRAQEAVLVSGAPCLGGSAWSRVLTTKMSPETSWQPWQAQGTHCGEGLTQALLLHPFLPSH